MESLPSREAWIEISIRSRLTSCIKSLPSREAWIEIWHPAKASQRFGRFPRGKRGLKSPLTTGLATVAKSLPSREAWIEIFTPSSFPAAQTMSLPSREAWIEIMSVVSQNCPLAVASLAGSVD